MVRTIPLPARDGRPGGEPMRINADHIVMLEPVVSRTTAALVLRVQLKLTSSPLMDVWLGEYGDALELDAGWQSFLGSVRKLVRLIALPDRDGPAGAASKWISPDHIGVLQPMFSTTGTTSILRAQLKLVGMELMDVWLGEFADDGAANDGWRAFVDAVHRDPATS